MGEFYHYRDTEHEIIVPEEGILPHEDGTSRGIRISTFYKQTHCQYCEALLTRLVNIHEADHADQMFSVMLCTKCGWWKRQSVTWAGPTWIYGAAVLKKFEELTDDVPMADLRRALAEDWRLHKTLSAGRAEEIVAWVFSDALNADLLYFTNAVNTPDGGIDFVLVTREDGKQIAFQVKRRIADKNEGVEEVRAFIGALTLSQFDRGFFVTTAEEYSRAVRREIAVGSANLQRRHLRIDLIQAGRLRELLNLNQPLGSSIEHLVAYLQQWDGGWHLIPPGDPMPGMWAKSDDLLGRSEKFSTVVPLLIKGQ